MQGCVETHHQHHTRTPALYLSIPKFQYFIVHWDHKVLIKKNLLFESKLKINIKYLFDVQNKLHFIDETKKENQIWERRMKLEHRFVL